jgi:outer membrane lipoprotein-sorting protein
MLCASDFDLLTSIILIDSIFMRAMTLKSFSISGSRLRLSFRSLVLCVLMSVNIISVSRAADLTPLQILDKADDKLDIKKSKVELEMLVYRNNELRKTYRMLLSYQDADHTMTETTFPPRNEGEKMLQSSRRNYWMFLPNINRSIRISESNNFSNSDFSNSDILSPRLSNEYTPKLLGMEKLNGEEAFQLELLAKDETTPYAKIVYWIRKADFFPLRREYYTFSQQLLKRLDMAVTTQAMKGNPDTLVMSSVLEKDKKTVLRYLKFTGNKEYPEGSFHPDALMKR